MSKLIGLEASLKDILNMVEPSLEDWDRRVHIIEKLQDVVNSVESVRGASVEPFGSFVSNLFSRSGDLDICILLFNGKHISSSGRKLKQSLLADVLRALSLRGEYQKLQFISNAKVPILKFETRDHHISCDVSVDNLQGQMKSKLLYWISGIDGRFRDIVLLVKEWAKAHRINNPKTGSLNSYSLSLLVIFHFQTCDPPILPPLEQIYPGNVAEDLIGVRADAEERITEICVANINKYKSNRNRAINKSSLSELFISFLAKFSDIERKSSTIGICTYTGKWEEIHSNMRWLPKTYTLLIEDPFERPENAARGVSSSNLTRIAEIFYSTYCRLVSPGQDWRSLVGILTRTGIQNSLVGAQAGTSNGASKPGNWKRNVPLPSPLKPTFQNQIESRRNSAKLTLPRKETYPNRLSTETVENYSRTGAQKRQEQLPSNLRRKETDLNQLSKETVVNYSKTGMRQRWEQLPRDLWRKETCHNRSSKETIENYVKTGTQKREEQLPSNSTNRKTQHLQVQQIWRPKPNAPKAS